MKRTIIFFILSELWINFLIGQLPQELLKQALKENLTYRALAKSYEASLQQIPQVSTLPQPELGIGGFILPVETRVGTQQFRLGASQQFPWFGTLAVKANVENLQSTIEEQKLTKWKWELFYQIQIHYFQLYELRQGQHILQKNIEILNALKGLTEAKVASGHTTLADILRIDLKLQELHQQIAMMEIRQQAPLAQLNQLLHRPFDSPVEVQDSLGFASLAHNTDSLKVQLQQFHPSVQQLYIQQHLVEQALQLNEKEGKPSFGLGFQYITVDALATDVPANGQDIFQLNASITLPLYRKSFKAKEREEQLNLSALQLEQEDMINRFAVKLTQAYIDYEEASLQAQLLKQQIATVQSAIRILETDYSNQSRSFDDLLQSEEDLIEYDLALLKATVRSHLAKAEIQRYLPL